MGSKYSDSSLFDVLAFIPASDLVSSSSTSQAYGPKNGVYWYYYSGYSVGFASSSSIRLGSADTNSTDCSRRLSWYLDQNLGGYRSGCNTDIRGGERKIIYSCLPTKDKQTFALLIEVMMPYTFTEFDADGRKVLANWGESLQVPVGPSLV
jgi:hypothetical protein